MVILFVLVAAGVVMSRRRMIAAPVPFLFAALYGFGGWLSSDLVSDSSYTATSAAVIGVMGMLWAIAGPFVRDRDRSTRLKLRRAILTLGAAAVLISTIALSGRSYDSTTAGLQAGALAGLFLGLVIVPGLASDRWQTGLPKAE